MQRQKELGIEAGEVAGEDLLGQLLLQGSVKLGDVKGKVVRGRCRRSVLVAILVLKQPGETALDSRKA